MSTDLPCPCSAAITGIVGEGVSTDQAILADEKTAFRVLASGARCYVRWHDTAHTPTEVAGELDPIARRLRTTPALLEQLQAENPPEHGTPGLLAGQQRSCAHAYGQIAAHLYREAAHLDAAAPVDHLVGGSTPPACPTSDLTKPHTKP